ncbi:MAG: choice-of-anchor J domain-containing protein [Sodaliphilus sp.]
MRKFLTSLWAAMALMLASASASSSVLATKSAPASKPALCRPTANAVPELKQRKAVSVANLSTATETLAQVPGSNTVLCGVKVFDDAWAEDGATIDAGIYTIEAKASGAIKSVKTAKEWMYTRAAIKIGGTYYVLSSDFSGETSHYSNYSTSTWYKGTSSEIDAMNVATDLAYDPVTGKVYGYFYDENTGDYTRFCEFSISMGESTKIADADRSVYAIACNKAGELYGVGSTGRLYKIDKTTGAQISVGHTGLYPVDRNSMTFDDATGRLYWAATYEIYEDGKRKWVSGLYEVNVHNGKLTKIKDLPGNASFSGIFAMPYSTPLSAPRAVSDISVNFANFGDTNGDITFTAPSLNVDGSAISDNINVIVNNAGTDTVVTDIAPGATYTMQNVSLAPGYQTLSFTTANSEYQGELAWHTVYVGEDVPGTPQNVMLEDVGGKAVLSWTPAPLGMNGGEYNKSTVAYKIVRQPDAVVVSDNCSATSFTDETIGNSTKAYFYEVSAFTAKGMSDAAASNRVTFGEGYSVPFCEGFDNEDAFNLWTIIDNNAGSTWAYDATGQKPYYRYDQSPDKKPGDDWLISPKIALKAGVTYRFSIYARNYSKKYPENFKVALATAPEPTAMTTELLNLTDFNNTDGAKHQVSFTVPADGYYHLGIYEFSNPYMYRLDIDDVAISILDNNAPAAVTDFRVTPGEMGALSATLSMNAPTTDTKGGSLSEISAVNVYRGDETAPAYSFLNPAPGDALSWTDNTITQSGIYTYRAVAVNSAGTGAEVTASAFVGVDKPGAPQNLTLEDHDGNAVLSWDAPTVGSNGGYIDVSKLYYQVWRYDNYTLLADSLSDTHFTDTTVNVSKQTLIDYVVFPYIGDVRGDYALSDAVIFGNPYKAPLSETFKNSDMNYSPWVTESDKLMKQSWTLDAAGTHPVASDQNGDGGFATFHSVGEGIGIHARLSSPKIDISSLENPELSFWMYHSHIDTIASAESIEIEVKNGNGAWEKVEGAKWMRDNGTTGWMRHTVLLEGVKGCNNLRIAFLGTTDGGQDVYVDNVTIANAATIDLEATAFAAPRKIARGENAQYSVKVTNLGNTPLTAYSVAITDASGKQLASATHDGIAAGEQQEVDFTLNFATEGCVTLTACVSADGDQNAANDAASASTLVVAPVIPAPADLTASVSDGVVSLSWRAADARGAVTDSIEAYTDFAIDSIGDWTMVDRDYDVTYMIHKDLDTYPNATSAKAFQVCNAKRLGIDIWTEGKPHSGDKMLMAMANVNYVNNDWMISPQLNGASQVVSFFAKAFTNQDGTEERMRVLYSTTDTDPAHFTQVSRGEYVELPDSWTEYAYRVPEGAKYFAINCVSPAGDQSFALFIDDLSFNDLSVPVLQLTGYEVYRNGELIATTTEPSYTDAAVAPLSEASYRVRAVYDKATSAPSNEVQVKVSGISETLAATVESVTYINSLGMQSNLPFEGVNIVVTRFTNGTTATSKLVK